jgi:hypothetical protein
MQIEELPTRMRHATGFGYAFGDQRLVASVVVADERAPPTLIAVLPRRILIRMSREADSAGASGNCTNAGAIPGAVSMTGIGTRRVGGSIPRSRIQRRTWFALTPLAHCNASDRDAWLAARLNHRFLEFFRVIPPAPAWLLDFHRKCPPSFLTGEQSSRSNALIYRWVRRVLTMVRASVTMSAVMRGFSDQPTTSRLNRSSTMARYSQPSSVHR